MRKPELQRKHRTIAELDLPADALWVINKRGSCAHTRSSLYSFVYVESLPYVLSHMTKNFLSTRVYIVPDMAKAAGEGGGRGR